MLIESVRTVRRGPAGTTSRAKLQRPLEVAEFYAEPGECLEGVDNESTAVAGVVIALLGIRPLLDGTVDTDRVYYPFLFCPGMSHTCFRAGA